MKSAAASVLSHRDQSGIAKGIPRPSEMVRVDGQKGLFLVKRVDREHGVADLLRRAKPQELETNVPFRKIRNVAQDVSKAIQKFLRS